MEDKDLRKLSRQDLLEMMLGLSEENEKLKMEVQSLQEELEDRTIRIRSAGNLAEACVTINELIETTQKTADQYLSNIQEQHDKCEAECEYMKRITRQECQKLIDQTRFRCTEMLRTTRQRIQDDN